MEDWTFWKTLLCGEPACGDTGHFGTTSGLGLELGLIGLESKSRRFSVLRDLVQLWTFPILHLLRNRTYGSFELVICYFFSFFGIQK